MKAGIRALNGLLAFVILATAGMLIFGGSKLPELQPKYHNKTEVQQWADEGRLYSGWANACNAAGGTWVVGFSNAYCTVAYREPDTSWYVRPVFNNLYDILEEIGIGMIAFGIVVGILGLIAIFEAIEPSTMFFFKLPLDQRNIILFG